MPTNDVTQYYQGPADLAKALEKRFPPDLMVLSPRGLQKLVGLTYRVSLMKEEGRYPCFQILTPQFEEQLSGLSVHFETPLPLDRLNRSDYHYSSFSRVFKKAIQ